MRIQPYLFFNGHCDEALDFYRRAVGAEIKSVMRYRESPEPVSPEHLPPGFEDKIMHAEFRVGETTVMASDGNREGPATFEGVSLTLLADTPADAERYFSELAQGGQIQMPLGKSFFAAQFGMVTDRFGLTWLVIALN